MQETRGWKKEPPYKGEPHHGCLNCGCTEQIAPMDMVIGVGFGSAYATRDGEVVYDEMDVMHKGGDFDDLWTLSKLEEMAVADPDHDWRVNLYGPLRGREYQRHGAGQWVLIHSDQGFA